MGNVSEFEPIFRDREARDLFRKPAQLELPMATSERRLSLRGLRLTTVCY